MMKTAFALAMALGLGLVAQKASAATDSYTLRGNSCTSITSGITGLYGQYGISPPSTTAINVTCPIILPQKAYTQFDLSIWAYSRSTPDKVACTIATTDYGGSNYTSATAAVTLNQANSQNATTTLYPSGGDEMYITCHIPGSTGSGPSYLTLIDFSATY